MNKPIKEKPLVDKLHDIENAYFNGFNLLNDEDADAIRQARYIIIRMCKKASEDTTQQIRDLIDLMPVDERVDIIEGLAKYFLTNSEVVELIDRL